MGQCRSHARDEYAGHQPQYGDDCSNGPHEKEYAPDNCGTQNGQRNTCDQHATPPETARDLFLLLQILLVDHDDDRTPRYLTAGFRCP